MHWNEESCRIAETDKQTSKQKEKEQTGRDRDRRIKAVSVNIKKLCFRYLEMMS